VNIADDLEAIRTALGLRRLDVLGRSYGTYPAQVYTFRKRSNGTCTAP